MLIPTCYEIQMCIAYSEMRGIKSISVTSPGNRILCLMFEYIGRMIRTALLEINYFTVILSHLLRLRNMNQMPYRTLDKN